MVCDGEYGHAEEARILKVWALLKTLGRAQDEQWLVF